MDGSYSIPRRIWRILYPPLILIAIQIIVMVIAGLIVGISLAVDGAAIYGADEIMEEIIRLAAEHSMMILLATNIVCFAVFLPIWLKTRKYHEIRQNERPGVICLLILGLFAAFNIVQMMVFALTDVMKYFPSYDGAIEVFETGPLAVQLLAIGIAAPIVEELVFRGILMSRMRWLPVWASVFIQGVLFGAVHLNIFQGLYAFVAGILLGLIYIKFQSIIVVIIGHMAYNFASLLLDVLVPEEAAGIVVMLAVVLLPICAILTIKHKKAERVLTGQENKPASVFVPVDPWERTDYSPF